jgi:hypothetical protein
MKNLRHFLFTFIVMLFSFGIVSAKDPANRKNKSSFRPCPVNASAGKRAQVRTTTIRKKIIPAHVKHTKTVKQKTVKQKTVKTKTVKQKQEKVKTEKQPKQKKSRHAAHELNYSGGKSHSRGKKTTSVSRSVF